MSTVPAGTSGTNTRHIQNFQGKPQKRYFFSGPATERGGGKGQTTKKNNFFRAGKKIRKFLPTKLEGGGASLSYPKILSTMVK